MLDGAISMLKKSCLGEGAEDMDYAVIDTRTGDKFDMGKLEELVSMPPWMSPKRLVVIKQSGLPNRELSDKDIEILKDIPSSAVVVFFEETVDSRKKAFKAFQQYGTVASMSGFEEEELTGWITKRFAKENIKIGFEAANSMSSRCANNMMELVNEFYKKGSVTKDEFKTLLILLNPVAPHITEELWEKLGEKDYLFRQSWPEYDDAKTKESVIEIGVQVNGKVRGTVSLAVDASQEEALAAGKAAVADKIEGKTIVKEIYVPGRILNIVVK
jgi:leucyl-tRNA synthetase